MDANSEGGDQIYRPLSRAFRVDLMFIDQRCNGQAQELAERSGQSKSNYGKYIRNHEGQKHEHASTMTSRQIEISMNVL